MKLARLHWPDMHTAFSGWRFVVALVLAITMAGSLNCSCAGSLPLAVSPIAMESGVAGCGLQIDCASQNHGQKDGQKNGQDGNSVAIHLHDHCACHGAFAFTATYQLRAPAVPASAFALATITLASQHNAPLPEPPRA